MSPPPEGSNEKECEKGIIVEVGRNMFYVASSSHILILVAHDNDDYEIGDCIEFYSRWVEPRSSNGIWEHRITDHRKCPNFVNFEVEKHNRGRIELICNITNVEEKEDQENGGIMRQIQTDFLEKVYDFSNNGATRNWRDSTKLIGMRIICERVIRGNDYTKDYWIVADDPQQPRNSKAVYRVTGVEEKQEEEHGGVMRVLKTDSDNCKFVFDFQCVGVTWSYKAAELMGRRIICEKIENQNRNRIYWIVKALVASKAEKKRKIEETAENVEKSEREPTVGFVFTKTRQNSSYYVWVPHQDPDIVIHEECLQKTHQNGHLWGKWISFILNDLGQIDEKSCLKVMENVYPTMRYGGCYHIFVSCSFNPEQWDQTGIPVLESEEVEEIEDRDGVLQVYERLDGFEKSEAWVRYVYCSFRRKGSFVLSKNQNNWAGKSETRNKQKVAKEEREEHKTIVEKEHSICEFRKEQKPTQDKENSSDIRQNHLEKRNEQETNGDSLEKPEENRVDSSGHGNGCRSYERDVLDEPRHEHDNFNQRQENGERGEFPDSSVDTGYQFFGKRSDSQASSLDAVYDYYGNRVTIDIDKECEYESEGEGEDSYYKMKCELTRSPSVDSADYRSIHSDGEYDKYGNKIEDVEDERRYSSYGRIAQNYSDLSYSRIKRDDRK